MSEKKITLGGKVYTLHPCPAIGLKAIGRAFADIGENSEIGLDALIDGIYYGVRRGIQGDPEFTRDFVAWNIDSLNISELTQAFAEVNGATKKTPGEPSTGEA